MLTSACFLTIWAPKPLSIFTMAASICLALPALIGNTLLVLAVLKDPLNKLRSPFNYFLVNLAVSDLTVACTTLPISAWSHINESNHHFPRVTLFNFT